jgi:hypothetical protein
MKRSEIVEGKYKYFVSYAHPSGYGMIQITMTKPWNTYEDVQEVAEHIKEKNGFEVTILNWKELQG